MTNDKRSLLVTTAFLNVAVNSPGFYAHSMNSIDLVCKKSDIEHLESI